MVGNFTALKVKRKWDVKINMLLIVFGFINYYFAPIVLLLFSAVLIKMLNIGEVPLYIGLFLTLSLLFELPVASILVTLLMRRLFRQKMSFRSSLTRTLLVFVLCYFLASAVNSKIAQNEAAIQNPLPGGSKSYDFSREVLVADRNPSKFDFSISDNHILWSEHTKIFPPFPRNVWDIFVFKFSSQTSVGSITQLSNNEDESQDNPHKIDGKAKIYDNNIFYLQGNTLYKYDPKPATKSIIVKNVDKLIGTYNNRLVFRRKSTDLGGNSSNGTKGEMSSEVIILDLVNKKETRLPELNSFEQITMNGEKICGITNKYQVIAFDLTTHKSKMIDFDTVKWKSGVQCNGRYLYYLTTEHIGPNKANFFDFKLNKTVTMDANAKSGHSIIWDEAKLIGDRFYFTHDNKTIRYLDLGNYKEVAFTELDYKSEKWDTDGEFVVYSVQDQKNNISLRLHRVLR